MNKAMYKAGYSFTGLYLLFFQYFIYYRLNQIQIKYDYITQKTLLNSQN